MSRSDADRAKEPNEEYPFRFTLLKPLTKLCKLMIHRGSTGEMLPVTCTNLPDELCVQQELDQK